MRRRRFSDEFKAKVALEAIKGQKTGNELAHEFGIHVNQMRLRRTSQPVEKAAYGSSTEGIQPLPAAGRVARIEKLRGLSGRGIDCIVKWVNYR